MSDRQMIDHPPHYTQGIECWDYITSQGMDYLRGNAIKYITRAPHKGKPTEDIDKAIAYLQRYKRELELCESEHTPASANRPPDGRISSALPGGTSATTSANLDSRMENEERACDNCGHCAPCALGSGCPVAPKCVNRSLWKPRAATSDKAGA